MATKGMRVKEMGATINLGDYSSLRVTIGEETEFAGLDIAKAEKYLKNIAKSVGGVLNLPGEDNKGIKENTLVKQGEELFAYGTGEKIYYDNSAHSYADNKGIKYISVTQLVGSFYPMNNSISQEYLDFASAYGNMVHATIQNSVIGKRPTKLLVDDIVNVTLKEMGEIINPVVEKILVLPEEKVAGRFDILSEDENGDKILWDVKTNTDLFKAIKSNLPQELKEEFGKSWNTETIYGEHCLQLNIYAYILEKHCGMKVSKIKIIHIPDGFKEILEVPKIDISKVFDCYGQNR